MAINTKGKGPFASRGQLRTSPPDHNSPRWAAPPVTITDDSIEEFFKFLSSRKDAGVLAFFVGLSKMKPQYRLARNLSSFAKLLAAHDIRGVLIDGLSEMENNVLMQLEKWGIPLDLLGVAHALLNIRDRRDFLVHFGHVFLGARLSKS